MPIGAPPRTKRPISQFYAQIERARRSTYLRFPCASQSATHVVAFWAHFICININFAYINHENVIADSYIGQAVRRHRCRASNHNTPAQKTSVAIQTANRRRMATASLFDGYLCWAADIVNRLNRDRICRNWHTTV